MVEGWNAWANPKDRGRATVYDRHDAQLFAERSRRDPVEAERLIVEAQGLEPLPDPTPQPMEAPPEPPRLEPTDTEEDVSAWM